MNSVENAERIREIRDEISSLLDEAKSILLSSIGDTNEFRNLEAYVFDQISENLTKDNRYNQDFEDVALAIENSEQEEEEEEEEEEEYSEQEQE